MAAFAPLFSHWNDRVWPHNLIIFNNHKCVPTLSVIMLHSSLLAVLCCVTAVTTVWSLPSLALLVLILDMCICLHMSYIMHGHMCVYIYVQQYVRTICICMCVCVWFCVHIRGVSVCTAFSYTHAMGLRVP